MSDTARILLYTNHWMYGNSDPYTFAADEIYTFHLFRSDDYSQQQKIYYGDEIDLAFWELLDLDFGTPDGDPYFTLQDGYLYQYWASLQKAVYYDNTGRKIYERDNITTVEDLHIDFTIHKSHQFEIIIGYNNGFVIWMKPAILKKKTYGESPVIKYHKILWEPPYPSEFALISSHDRLYEAEAKYKRKVQRTAKLKGDISAINPNLEFSGIAGQVYADDFKPFKVIRKPMYFTLRSFIPVMVLPWLSLSLYPDLEPILRPAETQNNRPIIQPWLIQLFKFIIPHPVEPDDDAWPVNVLDLSPNWSY